MCRARAGYPVRLVAIALAILLAAPSDGGTFTPTACRDWTLYRAHGRELAVCHDEAAFVMGWVVAVTLNGPGGAERVLVGYRRKDVEAYGP